MRPIPLLIVSATLALLVGCGGYSDPPAGVPAQVETRAMVKQIIARQFNIAEDTFSLADPIMGKKLGADELDLVELVMELEDNFQIVLPDAVLIGSESDSGFQAGLTGQQLANLVESERQKN
tara:strand:+ start:329 stop:694 length:366 start_codon:yes stop_codon:yes gene_type:complete